MHFIRFLISDFTQCLHTSRKFYFPASQTMFSKKFDHFLIVLINCPTKKFSEISFCHLIFYYKAKYIRLCPTFLYVIKLIVKCIVNWIQLRLLMNKNLWKTVHGIHTLIVGREFCMVFTARAVSNVNNV